MHLPSARDLGLEVLWRHDFVSPGERAVPMRGAVFLDVGGVLAPGVLDHHGAEGATCAAQLVVDRPELVHGHLLDPWMARAEAGSIPPGTRWSPLIVTHADPDFDAVVATWLVRRLVEEGQFPPEARALAAYALRVDQGRAGLDPSRPECLRAAHVGYLMVQNIERDHRRKIERGLALIDALVEAVRTAGIRVNGSSDLVPVAGAVDEGAGAWFSGPAFSDVVAELEEEAARWERDRGAGQVLEAVRLPARDGKGDVTVPAFVAARGTESRLNKYWVRAAGFPLFICPVGMAGSATKGPPDTVFSRVILSVDPTWAAPDGRKPSLVGLGYALERAEVKRRTADGGRDERGGEPRYRDGSCDNADPWYDGRAHDFTIVDSPHAGTQLPYREVVGIATGGRFWHVPIESGSVVLVRWNETPVPPVAVRHPIGRFRGRSRSLELLSDVAFDIPRPAPAPPGPGLSASAWTRWYSPESTVSLDVTEIRCGTGSTLQELVPAAERLVDRPAYRLVRLELGTHFSGKDVVDGLLQRLGGDNLRAPDKSPPVKELAFSSGRCLLLLGKAPHEHADGDPDREILLYLAYLWESLVQLSRRVSRCLPQGSGQVAPEGQESAEELLSAYARFQARDYQVDVSRRERAQRLFEHLGAAIGLRGQYDELGREIAQLSNLERRQISEREARDGKVLAFFLFLISCVGTTQTFLTFYRSKTTVVEWAGSLAFISILAGVFLYFRFRGPKRR